MDEQVIVRGPAQGRTLLVGSGDYVTYKARSAETGGAYFCFEVSTTPGFGPPLHTHAYRELSTHAAEHGVALRFESTVMDGTPLFGMAEAALPATTINGLRGLLKDWK